MEARPPGGSRTATWRSSPVRGPSGPGRVSATARVLSAITPTCVREQECINIRIEEGRTMRCPHCESADTSERRERTALGYRRFRCPTCKREFNERTGTRFNHLQYP